MLLLPSSACVWFAALSVLLSPFVSSPSAVVVVCSFRGHSLVCLSLAGIFPSSSGFLLDFPAFRIVVSPLICPLSVALLLLSASGIHFVALGVLLFPAAVVLFASLSVFLRVLSACPFS